MPTNMPTLEIDHETAAPQRFESLKHARRIDAVRGVLLRLGCGPMTTDVFMDYTEAVRMHEVLSAALAFLDRDE